MNELFEPTELNGLQLKNRFVRAATWEGMADESGGCTPRLVELYTRLAQGEVGLIITGHSYVLPEGKHAPRQLGIYKDALIPGLKSLTQAVHEGGGKIVIQTFLRRLLSFKKPGGEDDPHGYSRGGPSLRPGRGQGQGGRV